MYINHSIICNIDYAKIFNFYHIIREKLAQAYDFALEKIGMDLHSYSIWTDYIQFLKSVDAIGSYAENQKITAVRKVNFTILYCQ